jgi:hypothetical protein
MQLMRTLPYFALPAVLALAACVPSVPQPSPAPPPAPTPAPAPPPAAPPPPPPANWMDAPQTPGDWRYQTQPGGGIATFLAPGGATVFEMTCDGGRQVTLAQPGRGGNQMIVRSEALERTLPATAAGGAALATLAPSDRLLDAMAFSKGRFAIEVPGTAPLYLPAWPEVTRVIEDCR